MYFSAKKLICSGHIEKAAVVTGFVGEIPFLRGAKSRRTIRDTSHVAGDREERDRKHIAIC